MPGAALAPAARCAGPSRERVAHRCPPFNPRGPPHAQEPVLRQQLAELSAVGESGAAALAIALAPQPMRAGRSTNVTSTLALALSNGHVGVHTLADEFSPRPGKSRDEARAEWKRKLRELETFVA